MKNFEVKAVARDLGRLRKILRAIGAKREPRMLEQVDQYFVVPRGRLKLRCRKGKPGGELIFYVRPDSNKARTSEYHKLPATDAPGLLRLLASMFVPGVSVRKTRDLWLLDQTRIHLDRVQRLGTFVEIEVPFDGNAARARRVMRALAGRLGIAPADVLDCSYADLLARRAGEATRGARSARGRSHAGGIR